MKKRNLKEYCYGGYLEQLVGAETLRKAKKSEIADTEQIVFIKRYKKSTR